jgi:hypothetical protein
LAATAFLIGAAGYGQVEAAPITVQGYTVTDLGAGSATISTDGSGNRIVIAPDGHTAYAFPHDEVPTSAGSVSQTMLAKIPLIDPPPTYSPDTYGNPSNAFAFIQSAFVNEKGVAAVLEVTGVNGHWYAGDAYYVQANPNGTWGAPVRIFSGLTDIDGSAMPHPVSPQQLGISIAGINNVNQVLGSLQTGPSSSQSGPFVDNIVTQTSTQLGNLNGNYLNVQPIAIADNGTLLLQGQPVATGGPDHALILTPDGIAPNPLTVAPEPAAWAVMLLAAAALVVHQSRER